MTQQRSSPLRYEPLVKVASGGAATVFVGAARGALGFRQIVAIKRPHPHLCDEPGFRESLLAEARVASRIHHANVVDVRDVEEVGDTIQLVMDYVEGATLGQLITLGARSPEARIPPAVAVRVVLDACAGLHAAHELTDESGVPLGLVHRDVSPQNILVGLDGVSRVTDFGVAKELHAGRKATTDGALKGKIGYFAPEYVRGKSVDRRADVFALGVVLWEALAHKRLFRGANEAEALDLVLREPAPPVSAYAPEVGTALDAVVAKAVAKAPEERFATARDLGEALEAAARSAGLLAGHAEVARAVGRAVGDEIAERRRLVQERLAASESSTGEVAPTSTPELPSTRPPRVRRWLAAPALLALIAVGTGVALTARSTRSVEPVPGAGTAAPLDAATAPASAITTSEIPPVDVGSSVREPASGSRPTAEPPTARSAGTPQEAPRPAGSSPRRGPRALPANPYR